MKQRFFQAYANEWCAKYGQKHVDYFSFGKERSEGPDPHSLNKERVNGILPNMDDWYDLFGVKPGDKLYLAPADRIHIW